MPVAALGLLAGAVLAGGGAQRLAGMGFSLVASPFLVLLLGPFEGVLLSNLLNLFVTVIVMVLTWREADRRRALVLAGPALVALVPGAWVARNLPAPVLSIVIGSLLVVALLVVTFVHRARVLHGTVGGVVAGAVSGFMNVTAGVGGPAMALYATSSGWAHSQFVATMQLYFVLVNAGSLIAKGALPDISGPVLLVAVLALAIGAGAGHVLSRHVPPHVARGVTTTIAVLGGLATLVKGLLAL